MKRISSSDAHAGASPESKRHVVHQMRIVLPMGGLHVLKSWSRSLHCDLLVLDHELQMKISQVVHRKTVQSPNLLAKEEKGMIHKRAKDNPQQSASVVLVQRPSVLLFTEPPCVPVVLKAYFYCNLYQ